MAGIRECRTTKTGRSGATPRSSRGCFFLLLLLSSAYADAPKEGCYERIAVGRRIPSSEVIASSVPAATLSLCRAACDAHPGALCGSFAFGIGNKLGPTCDLGASSSSWAGPPFVRIESTSTLRLHSSPPPDPSAASPTALGNATQDTSNSTSSSPTQPADVASGNSTARGEESRGEASKGKEDASTPGDADVDFDLYVKRPASHCERSSVGSDPWILRPLPSYPPSNLPPSPSSSHPPTPPSSPPSPTHSLPQPPHSSAHPHPAAPSGHQGHGPKYPPPSVHLKPPPLFQNPSHRPPIPPIRPQHFRPSHPHPSGTYLPPLEGGTHSYGPPPHPFGPHFSGQNFDHDAPNRLGPSGGGLNPFGPGQSLPQIPPQEVGGHGDCFRRVGMGRLIPDSFVHRTLHSPSLEHCRVSCTGERHFRCEGFAYRWDVAACQLTAAPLSALEFRDLSLDSRVEYFARDIAENGRCPPVGASVSPPTGGPPRGPPWRPNYGSSNGGQVSAGYGPGRPVGEGESHGGRPHGGGATLPGFYGPSRREPTPVPAIEQTVREEGFGFSKGGTGSWGVSGLGGQQPLAHSSDRFPAADSPGGVWHRERRPTWSRGPECFVPVKRGFRLTPDGRPHPAPSDHEEAHHGDLLFVSMRVRSQGPRECAQECFRSRQFHCEAFSYRFNGDPRTQGLSNCDLSGQPLQKLDPYKDLVQDRDYDVYGRTLGRACGDDSIIMGPLENFEKRPPLSHHHAGGTSDGGLSHSFPPSRSPPPSLPPSSGPPGYLDNSLGTGFGSSWSGASGSSNDHTGGQDVTVGGRACATGTSCTRHPDGGFWGCPVASLESDRKADKAPGKDWDYCCRPGHQCGYSEGYHLPWCYVGSADRDQWRPCSQDHYPPSPTSSGGASNNITKGGSHHFQGNINSFAYLHNVPPTTGNYTPIHHDKHSVLPKPSLAPSAEEEKDSIIQQVYDLLSSGGKNKSAQTQGEENKLQISLKSEKVPGREGRTRKENRAYGRRADQVRYFHPVSAISSSHPSEHSKEDASLESQETRILQSNFTIVESTDT